MKTTIITLLSLLLLNSAVDAQQFTERKFPRGRRPWRWHEGWPQGKPPKNINDGRPPIAQIGSSGDGLSIAGPGQTSNEVLVVSDGKTLETLWTFDFKATLVADDIQLVGFFDLKGDESVQAVLTTPPGDDAKSDLWIVNFADQTVDFSKQGVQLLAVTELNGRSGPEIIVYIPDEGVISIVDYDDGGSTSNITKSATHSQTLTPLTTNYDYQLIMKFESKRRRRLAFDRKLVPAQRHFDFDLDGIIDIPVLVENANGDVVGMEVRDGDTFDVKWQYTFPQKNIEDILLDFHGFADVNGDGEPEGFLGSNLAVTLDGTLHEIDPNFKIRVLYDVDNDGFPDLVGVNLADTTVQVWGMASATSVSEEDLIVAGFQLEQNYPNPFNPSTTIRYSVENASEIELRIYNMLGQMVRTLVQGNKLAGDYSVVWDGQDDFGRQVTSGQYFYRFKASELQSTRAMILLK